MSEKDDNERLMKIIQACKIISDVLPNDSLNFSIKQAMPEILPKLIKLLPYLVTTVSFNDVDWDADQCFHWKICSNKWRSFFLLQIFFRRS